MLDMAIKFIKVIIGVSLAIILCCAGCKMILKKMLTVPMVKNGYQTEFEYQCPLEKKYAFNGSFEIDSISFPSNDETIKRFTAWFPSEMKSSDKKWPVVVMANGTGVSASRYTPIFEHLASWGFIVVGNEDWSSWFGHSTSTTLDFILSANSDESSPFYRKVNCEAIGLAGHSQGGVATFYAATQFENSDKYKAICSMSGNNSELASLINAPMLMISGTAGLDAQASESMNSCFDLISGQPVVSGILKDTDHGIVLPRGDAYMTAWMCWWLNGEEEAERCFFGDNAEISSNPGWKDIKRKGI